MEYDLVIKSARLRLGQLVDIAIANGKIAELASELDGSAKTSLDAAGRLTTESFVIAHLHLDKVHTHGLAGDEVIREYQQGSMGGALTAVEIASRVKEHYREDEIVARVRRVLTEAKYYGVSAIRAFADVDAKAKLVGVKALLKIREEFRDLMRIQVVAFPQDGIVRDPGAEEYMRKAMELGADVVGGIPWIEHTEEDAKRHVDFAFELAKKYDKDVAMLVDDAGDPNLRTTEYLAIKAHREGWTGRVAACHARATALYNEVHHRKLVALLKRAEMGVVTDPHTGPLHVRVSELLDSGVNVALGQDDVNDAYYPYGRCKMLEVAFLASHLLWMQTERDRETIYDMITTNPAKMLRLENYGLAPGKEANLVVLDANNMQDAFTRQAEASYVILRGNVVAQTSVERKPGN